MNITDIDDPIESIAIIGMSGIFPGANDIKKFWELLTSGVEAISHFSDEELIASGISPELLSNPKYVKSIGILENIDLFDAAFFGFNPKEAEITDPQHRLFLEHSWQALEDAGYDCQRCESRIGVYAGSSSNNYLPLSLNSAEVGSADSYQKVIGNDKDFLATRVSYKLNFTGPSLTVQTACSTSLVAIFLACQSLLNYQCDMALAGGVSIHLPQKIGYLYQEGGILSPDGHCRAFDAKARGTIIGNGLGIVVLKRLSEAIADGDHIYAVIKGSAINNDGFAKVGYTAPSINGQAQVIAEALALADVAPETISYIEAHGTGTVLGDPIEISALTNVFRESTQKKGFCAIGSVKTNIGHLDTASGIAGLIKTVLALKHQQIPPSLNFEQPNPEIDFANSPFYVNTKLRKWENTPTPRRAGVSSLGIGGTNVHVILEEAPDSLKVSSSRPWHLLLLSAKTNTALQTATENLVKHLRENPQLDLADVSYTLQVGRAEFNHRRMVVCQNSADATMTLAELEPQRVFSRIHQPESQPHLITFMFPGQGSQYINMTEELYQTEAKFREVVDHCCAILIPDLGWDLRSWLYPRDSEAQTAAAKLHQTDITQPALFVVEYALAQLWMSWGISPSAMIGHSIGEYVAACLAGVMSLEDALSLVAMRGRLMQQLPGGAMLSVATSAAEINTLLNEDLSLAACNAPSLCVVSGTYAAIDAIHQQLTASGVHCRRLHTSHAFHSGMMTPMIEPFITAVKKVKLNPPQIPFISNVTGTWITAEQATDPNYWGKHLRQPVQFTAGISVLQQQPKPILLEVGPGRTLCTFAQKHSNVVGLCSLAHPKEKQSDVAFLLNTLGKLWLYGVQVNWSGFYGDERRHRLPLPTYPFEGQRYWMENHQPPLAESAKSSSLGKKPDIADWFYLPLWKQSILPVPWKPQQVGNQNCCTLVLLDECGWGEKMVKQLELDGENVITVKAGTKFGQLGDRTYSLNPQQREDYDALLHELKAKNYTATTIVHLWSVTAVGEPPSGLLAVDQAQEKGFYSLLFLAQALGKQPLTNHKLQITVISNHLHSVMGEEALCPEKATILGAVKIIPQEYPHIICRSIDIAIPQEVTEPDEKLGVAELMYESLSNGTPLSPLNPPKLGDFERFGSPQNWGARGANHTPIQQREKLLANLLNELQTPSADIVIAYRGSHRWVQTFEPIRLETTKPVTSRLKQQGVYLITGGLGGVGLTLASYLAKSVQAKLVLIGRSVFPAKEDWEQWLATRDRHDSISGKIRQLQELEKLGAEVLVASADVANLEQMQTLIAKVQAHFSQINGVIHCAGVADYAGVISRRTREMTEKIMAPKVKGTLVLDSLLKDAQLDFFILCSSLSSIIYRSKFSEVGYCAANEFLDAFAHYKNTQSNTFTVAINWTDWQDVGMSVDAINRLAEKHDIADQNSLLMDAVSPAEGMKIFDTILNSNFPRIAVSTQELTTLIQRDQDFNPQAFLESLGKANQLKSTHPRPELSNAYVAPRNDTEQKIVDIWEKILGIKLVGIYDNFFELGGDSLLIVQLRDQLQKVFQEDVLTTDLFEYPTVSALAEYLRHEIVAEVAIQQVQSRAKRQEKAMAEEANMIKQRRKSRG